MISRNIKAILALLLALCMALCLAACSGINQDQQTGADDSAAPTEETQPSGQTSDPSGSDPTGTEPDTTEHAAPPEIIEQPERPMVVQIEPGAYQINSGDKLETRSTVYYLTEAGELYAMGSNDYYQLGTGNREMNPLAVRVMDGVKSIKGEGCRIFALKEDGSLWTWGIAAPYVGSDDSYGFTEPTKILDNVAACDGALALTESGELWLTENGADGVLSPEKMMDGVASFSSASASQFSAVTTGGELYSYAKYSSYNDDGTVNLFWDRSRTATGVKQAYCRGNFYLGKDDVLYGFEYNGSGTKPVAITDNVLKAYTGYGWVYAIKYDGTLWGWSDGESTGFPSECTQKAAKILDNVVYVTAEYNMGADFGVTYALALTGSGELYGWGPNWWGELAATDSYSLVGGVQETPSKMADDVKMVYSDGVNTFIIKKDNSLWGTGYNGEKGSQWEGLGGIGLDANEGRLGDGTSETHMQDGWHMFVKITDNAAFICQKLGVVYTDYPGTGYDSTHTFARVFMLDTNGVLWGWGYNKDGAIAPRAEAYLLEPKLLIDPSAE